MIRNFNNSSHFLISLFRQSLKWLHAQSLSNLNKKGGGLFNNLVNLLNTTFGAKSRLLRLLGGLDGSEDILKKYENIKKLVKIGKLNEFKFFLGY
uniref:Uncharacterized protein n=1 Tax=Meloidogyne enterolobii TaxID=390850 RepID=A0A6V7VAE5_MELEN|nr:unnamed protein product [Meloidogyne enterolobii]